MNRTRPSSARLPAGVRSDPVTGMRMGVLVMTGAGRVGSSVAVKVGSCPVCGTRAVAVGVKVPVRVGVRVKVGSCPVCGGTVWVNVAVIVGVANVTVKVGVGVSVAKVAVMVGVVLGVAVNWQLVISVVSETVRGPCGLNSKLRLRVRAVMGETVTNAALLAPNDPLPLEVPFRFQKTLTAKGFSLNTIQASWLLSVQATPSSR